MSAQPTTQSAEMGQPAPVPELASAPTLNDYISISPEIRFGKPCIAGTRIAVIDVAIWHNQLGMSPEQIAGDYNLDLPAVYAALSYYFAHREEIDRRHAEGLAYAEAMHQKQGPSKVELILAEREAKRARAEQRGDSDSAAL